MTVCETCYEGDCDPSDCDCDCHPMDTTSTDDAPAGGIMRPTAPTTHEVAPTPVMIVEVFVLRDPESKVQLAPTGVKALHPTEVEAIKAGTQAIADRLMRSFTVSREFHGPRSAW